ncbi:hypothetical protein G4B88_024946 [Cannabis sativa]|uniref:Uncharacterized protein n=1 Tax=Cannabis sativa TaxID=3483 RepID=A0A7J6G9J2_CANSA|nr:hypothetical protein G4B88_024946 [Cannabis sativa]
MNYTEPIIKEILHRFLPFSLCTIKPYFLDISIPGEEFSHLTKIQLIVLNSLPIRLIVAIPSFPGGGCQLADDIAGAVSPGAGTDRVIGVVRWPQAKPIVVFGCKNYPRKP